MRGFAKAAFVLASVIAATASVAAAPGAYEHATMQNQTCTVAEMGLYYHPATTTYMGVGKPSIVTPARTDAVIDSPECGELHFGDRSLQIGGTPNQSFEDVYNQIDARGDVIQVQTYKSIPFAQFREIARVERNLTRESANAGTKMFVGAATNKTTQSAPSPVYIAKMS